MTQVTIIKTAGIDRTVADWQLDRAYETETAADLERFMNCDDDFPASNVACDLGTVDYHLGQAVNTLARCSDLEDRYHKGETLYNLLERLEELRIDIREARRKECGNR